MNTADLKAGKQMRTLVALAQGWKLKKDDLLPYLDVWLIDGLPGLLKKDYDPLIYRAQWAKLIEVFNVSLFKDFHGWASFTEKSPNTWYAQEPAEAVCKAVIASEWGNEIPSEIWEKVA